jgi:microcin C transport system substrate-binding protein
MKKQLISFVLFLGIACGIALSVANSVHAQTVVSDPKISTFGKADAPQGGTFTINMRSEPSTLNPITGTDLYNFQIAGYVVDNLMERNPETYEWLPSLAEKMETSKDGLTFTFTLREGVKWQDGKPLTIDDVKFSFDVIFDPKYNAAHIRPYYENIEKAEVVDPRTIRFTVKEKYFKNAEVLAGLAILPKHFYGDAAAGIKKNKTILGSGPYKVEAYNQGQSLILAKNKEWWGAKLPWKKGQWNFEKIRVRFLKDDNATVESLKKGDIDLFDDVYPETFVQKMVGAEYGKSVIKEKVENKAPKDYLYIGWNLRHEMFKDKDTRMALHLLANRDEMNKLYRFNLSLLATGPWYQQSEYADPSVKAIPYDQKKAVGLLKKVGWALNSEGLLEKTIGGKKVPFRFTLNYGNKNFEKYYVMYQSDLRKVGIDMQLQLLEWNSLLKNMDNNDFDAVALRWTGGSVDMDPKQVWHSSSAAKGGSNRIGYANAEVDKLIEQSRTEMDKAKRVTMMRKIYRTIAEDVPYVFFFNDKYTLYAHTAKTKMMKPTYKYSVGGIASAPYIFSDYWWMAP